MLRISTANDTLQAPATLGDEFLHQDNAPDSASRWVNVSDGMWSEKLQ
jgi:hypothetical protein